MKKFHSYKGGKKPSRLMQILIIAIVLSAIAVTIFISGKKHDEIARFAEQQFDQQQLGLARLAARGIELLIDHLIDDLHNLSRFASVQRIEPGILQVMEELYVTFPPQTSVRRLDKNGILRFIYPYEG